MVNKAIIPLSTEEKEKNSAMMRTLAISSGLKTLDVIAEALKVSTEELLQRLLENEETKVQPECVDKNKKAPATPTKLAGKKLLITLLDADKERGNALLSG